MKARNGCSCGFSRLAVGGDGPQLFAVARRKHKDTRLARPVPGPRRRPADVNRPNVRRPLALPAGRDRFFCRAGDTGQGTPPQFRGFRRRRCSSRRRRAEAQRKAEGPTVPAILAQLSAILRSAATDYRAGSPPASIQEASMSDHLAVIRKKASRPSSFSSMPRCEQSQN